MSLTLLLGLSPVTHGETVYIKDVLYVQLRDGQSSEDNVVHQAIVSGTRLERLEQNEASGYSLIRMSDGLEGWLQSQYLVDEPVARVLLTRARSELDRLQTSRGQRLAELKELKSREADTTGANASLREKNDSLAQELQKITRISANAIALSEANEQLREEHDMLLAEIDMLAVANQSFQDTSDQQWFLRGAGTVLLSLLLGFWFSRRISQQRYRSGWS